MSNEHATDSLKKLGAQAEQKINNFIQDRLNDKSFIHLAKAGIQNHTSTLKKLRQYNDLLALQLNIPTKDDIANIAKMGIQLEEKIDLIEEKLSILVDELHLSKNYGNASTIVDKRYSNSKKSFNSPSERQKKLSMIMSLMNNQDKDSLVEAIKSNVRGLKEG
ncbi:MAG TPA: hypothetical protein VEV44_04870 [Pseudoneobacillus sp.]|nr:hypothetical protein [Pseudoneobacillus sp.]